MQKTGIYSEIPDDSPDITFSSSQITMIKRLDGIIRQILLRVVAAIPYLSLLSLGRSKQTDALAYFHLISNMPLCCLGIVLPHTGIFTIFLYQFVMPAAFNKLSLPHDQNLIGILHR